MPAPDRMIAFAIVSLVFVATPGPSVLFTVSRALAYGRRPALLTVVGNAAGVYLHVIAVAIGIGIVVQRSVAVFTVLKLVGAAYLIYLGVRAIRHRRSLAEALEADVPLVRSRRVVADGFVVGVSNPKSVVFFAAVLPQFVDSSNGHVWAQLLVLGGVAILAALTSDSVWAVVADGARRWFAKSPRRLEAIGGTAGLVMMGLGIQLAIAGRKE